MAEKKEGELDEVKEEQEAEAQKDTNGSDEAENENEVPENDEDFENDHQEKNNFRIIEIDIAKVTKRVYVGNLPYEVRWQDLKDYFRKAGNVAFAEVLLTPDGRSKGCGIVEFETKEEAMNAIQMLNDTEFGHRLIFVREDREAEPPRNNFGGYRSPSFRGRGGGNFRGNRGGSGGPGGPGGPVGRGGRGDFRGNSRGLRGGMGIMRGFGGSRGNGRQSTSGRKLFIGNLPWSTTWQDLKDAFSQCGSIVRADIISNQEGRSRGQATILFDNEEDARNAIDHFNNSNFQGRMIMVREDLYY